MRKLRREDERRDFPTGCFIGTKKASASPNLIIRQDSPIALLDVAQAVTMHMFGPRNPNSIEIKPLAMLLMSIGIVKGETRDGPLVIKMLC